MKLTTVGIDLAKNVFQVHGIDEHGKVLVKKQLRRDQMATFFVNLPSCLVGWRPAAALTTGRASCSQWVTPCV
jgi:transposase